MCKKLPDWHGCAGDTQRTVLLVSISQDMYVATTAQSALKQEGFRVVHAVADRGICDAFTDDEFMYCVLHDSAFVTPEVTARWCKRLRLTYPLIPLIVLTDRIEPKSIRVFVDHGADDFLAWPAGESLIGARLHDLRRRYADHRSILAPLPQPVFQSAASQSDCSPQAYSFTDRGDNTRNEPVLDNSVQHISDDEHSRTLDKMRAVYEAIPDLLLEVNGAGVFVDHFGNVASGKRGVGPGIWGKHISDIWPHYVAKKLMNAIATACKDNEIQFVDYELSTSRGTTYFEARVAPTSDNHALLVIRNNTRATLALKALSESEERFRSLAANLPGTVYRYKIEDGEWGIDFISESVEAFCGVNAQTILKNGLSYLESFVYESDRERIIQKILQAIEQRDCYVIEYRIRHLDGSIRWVNETGRAIYDEQEIPTFIDGMLFDVTPLKLLEEKLVRTGQMAVVGTLASGIAHEINNPMAAIIANIHYCRQQMELLHESSQNEDTPGKFASDLIDVMTTIENSLARVTTIVDELHLFADAAEQPSTKLCVGSTLDWVLFKLKPIIETHASLTTNYEVLPHIWANDAGLTQVFIHLITNCIEAFDSNDVQKNEICVRLAYNDESDVVIEVSDNGCGMAPEIADKVFNPFFSTKPVGDGVGLGLSICHGIIVSLGGDITIESRPRHGTIVRIILPGLNDEPAS